MHRVALDLGLDPVHIDRTWTVQDVLDMNEVLDVHADVLASRRPQPETTALPEPRGMVPA